MNKFAEAIRNEGRKTYTENGAKAYNSTADSCLDMFGSIGSLRMRSEDEIERIFAEAYKEDKLLATKILFYSRDIREGLGERRTFRTIIKYLANYHPEAIRPNLDLIGVYGRYDDLYELIDTPVEADMWKVMKAQFEEDRVNYENGNSISLLAKWIATPDASSKNTRKLGIKTAINLGYKVYDFKRILRELRAHLKIVESYMSAGEWDKITYSEVPSRAMMIYRNAFMKHDEDRYSAFIDKAVNGKAKINANTLYPYDISQKMLLNIMSRDYMWGMPDSTKLSDSEIKALEAQWRALPNYVEANTNALVIADLSGSMTCSNGLPMASSLALALYFAEHNTGDFYNVFIPFSSDAHIVNIKGDTLLQKMKYIFESNHGYCGSTNVEAAFDRVLRVAIDNKIPKEEMVKSLIIISDMEFNSACEYGYSSSSWSFYDKMRDKYANYGYDIPNIVFWNVNSRHDVFHADANRKGVQLVSGQSASTFKQLMNSIGMTPVEMMLKVINSERYEAITVG